MNQPLIGITTSFDGTQQCLDETYVKAIQRVLGLPILLPLVVSSYEAMELCQRIDGLVIPGGPGILKNSSGKFPEELSPVHPKRWESDNLILDVAIELNLPILGICYGMQLLCVRSGGSLYSDVEQQVEGTFVHSQKRGATNHDIEVSPDSYFSQIWESTTAEVNSRHIQAVCDAGKDYSVSARSSDGTVEAIERIDHLHIGVQFHPERMGSICLFKHLIKQAQRYRNAT
ncbi:MAG: gamma-glutamyl-gamma-aminobutyrate hydrolase family protein [Bacteroidetes bacterium]|nr:gamma-glutamyl-gamma-aminobutyrate hydrolase family protein [Bacteroidota bacterium]MCY4232138.1 gamma-glutamyl-gamma-aminobutyrate hydrolase family protein [Bacteroidota bacterium]